jgi:hypothetical protein
LTAFTFLIGKISRTLQWTEPEARIRWNERIRARSDFGCGTEGAATADGVYSLDRIAF